MHAARSRPRCASKPPSGSAGCASQPRGDQRLQRHHQRAAGEGRHALVGRVARADRRGRQHLPEALAGRDQPVDEAEGGGAEVADAVRAGQGGDVQQHAGAALVEVHGHRWSSVSLMDATGAARRRVRGHERARRRQRALAAREHRAAAVERQLPGAGRQRGSRARAPRGLNSSSSARCRRPAVGAGSMQAGEGVRLDVVPVVQRSSRAPRGLRQARRGRARRRRRWREPAAVVQQRLGAAQREQPRRRSAGSSVSAAGPVQPAGRVVLAVGVVVAALAVADLVAGAQHRRALREQQRGHHRAAHARRVRDASRGSSVGPSTPKLALSSSSRPSRLPSPLASLCLRA